MASPQIEDGYVKIANELLDALCKMDLKGGEFMIALAVIRKTYGWGKKEDQISLTQFEKLTLMSRPRILRSIKMLVQQGVLGSNRGNTSITSTYWIEKDYEKWTPSNRPDTSNRLVTRPSTCTVTRLVTQQLPDLVPGQLHTKDNLNKLTKETLKTILSQNEILLVSFGEILGEKIKIYIDRIKNKNKSKVITEGRKNTLLNELSNSRSLCNDDNIFGYALEETIKRDTCCIGYINAIIKNKKTKRPF